MKKTCLATLMALMAISPASWAAEKYELDDPSGRQFLPDSVNNMVDKKALEVQPVGQVAEKTRALLAQLDVFKDCPECPTMVVIPAGSFQMGGDAFENEKPIHTVTISGAFALARTEVTQGQWRAIMGNNPSYFSACDDDCPVENVSWNDALDYARGLSQRTGKTYYLPSEAEWEYACRAGRREEYCCSENLDSVAWHAGNSDSRTHAVGQKQKNAFGLYDMSGNVWEWVADCWHDSYTNAPTDGSAWSTGCTEYGRALRGGSWNDDSRDARAAERSRSVPTDRYKYVGFRVARMLP